MFQLFNIYFISDRVCNVINATKLFMFPFSFLPFNFLNISCILMAFHGLPLELFLTIYYPWLFSFLCMSTSTTYSLFYHVQQPPPHHRPNFLSVGKVKCNNRIHLLRKYSHSCSLKNSSHSFCFFYQFKRQGITRGRRGSMMWATPFFN